MLERKSDNINNIDEELFAKQMIQVAEKLRFDSVKTFYDHTKNDNLMVVTLKAHLHLENELEDLLKKFFNKDLVDNRFRNIDFKLVMAKDLGLIDNDVYKLFNKLRDIRNDYAHDLNFNIGEKEYGDLLSVVSKETKTSIKDFTSKVEGIIEVSLSGDPNSLLERYRALLSFLLMNFLQNKINFLSRIERKLLEVRKEEYWFLENKRQEQIDDI